MQMWSRFIFGTRKKSFEVTITKDRHDRLIGKRSYEFYFIQFSLSDCNWKHRKQI